MVRIKIFGENGEIQIEGDKSGQTVLKQLGLSSSSAIIMRNGRPIPEDIQLGDEDDITIIKSFSGG
ncbi:MAG: MoaD/ThiS family protein [Candidatus Thermoplasmatota archaeon]|jgi:sulfur carrier protein ThiS|nr:MoaD/ThiS family protein [Candidatus Thermoplasmatota archaeon]